MRIGIRCGIKLICDPYSAGLTGSPKLVVNPDFEDKAVDWLKDEVYARTSKGKECTLLEKVTVQTRNGMVHLKYIS